MYAKTILGWILIWLVASSWMATLAAGSMIDQGFAVLRVLDKSTARVLLFQVAVGDSIQLRRLQLTVRACREPPPLEPPESVIFLEAVEDKPGEDEIMIFQGWMFASSPGLSVMEHPVYDVWAIDCIPVSPEDVLE